MVQGGDVGEGAERPMRFRDRHRLARHREFLDAARRIITTEGSDALTMQRVTEAVGSSTGGIYVYFPSKDALIAELQREAIEALTGSYVRGQAALTSMLEERPVGAGIAAISRLLATGRFWIDAEDSFASEVRLTRGFLTPGSDADVVGAAEAERVVPSAQSLLREVTSRCAEAVEAGALAPGNDADRALMLVSSVNGVLHTSTLSRWDQALFDGRRLAAELVFDLAAGWGATSAQLGAADAELAAFCERATLAPPADDGA